MTDRENCLKVCTYQWQNKNAIIKKWKHGLYSKLKLSKN